MSRLALALSSSTGVMSAAVGTIGSSTPLAATTLTTDRRHAEEISPLILKLLADGGVSLDELDCLVVDRGPGRFTGLRVGLATIKTLSFALERPAVGLTSLEILAGVGRARMAPDVAAESAVVTAVIDARRNEVFQQQFGADGLPLDEASVGEAAVVAADAVGLVVGDGLDRYRVDYERSAGSSITLLSGIEVDAAIMLALAADRPTVPGADIEPLYLRDPDVNPNVKTRPRA